MSKIKLIDLFIKIANGEDTPKVIEFDGDIFTNNVAGNNYYCKEKDLLLEDAFVLEDLNREIEILDDILKVDKKIEKLRLSSHLGGTWQQEQAYRNKRDEELTTKINEIINKINGE